MSVVLSKYWSRLVNSSINILEYLLYYPKLKKCLQEISKSQNASDIDGDPMSIFDVGANRGQSARLYRRIFPAAAIYSFEPVPHVFEKLKNLPLESFYPFNVALSDTPGEKTLHQALLDETSTFELPLPGSKWQKRKERILFQASNTMFKPITVETNTLDGFLSEFKIKKIFFLKIDTEGHELSVLMGGRKALSSKKIKYIQLERHLDDQRPDDFSRIETLLNESGYTEFVKLKHSFGNFYDYIYVLKE